MYKNIYGYNEDPQEIPEKKQPGDSMPGKTPKVIPGTKPGKHNPRNPKEDVIRIYVH